MKRVLYLHRNDLRLHDNRCLLEASEHEILPVYILKNDDAFAIESLKDLNASYKQLGAQLHIATDTKELQKLIDKHNIQEIYCQELPNDTEIQHIEQLGLPIKTYETSTLFTSQQLENINAQTFEEFLQQIHNRIYVPLAFGPPTELNAIPTTKTDLPTKQLPELAYEPGESDVYNNHEHVRYDEIQPWIQHGCISVRTLYHNTQNKQLKTQLLKRDYKLFS